MDRNRLLSPQAVEGLIAGGSVVVIKDGRVLQLDGWIDEHPGGRLAVLHMVGRDATDEINIYHSAKTLRTMAAYQIGRIEAPWINFTPPIRGSASWKSAEVDFVRDDDDGTASNASLHRTESNTASNFSEHLSFNSSTTSLDILEDVRLGQYTLRKRSRIDELNGSRESSYTIPPPEEAFTPCYVRPSAHYPSAGENMINVRQKEIDDGIREYPSLDAETQGGIVLKYQELHQRVKDEGFYDCRYLEYLKETLRYSLIFAAFLAALHSRWYITSAAFLGLFWHQIMFTAHDAGHRGITHNFIADTLIGIFIADFCCGLSIGWWKSSHNVHHLITNHPEHDPDIQNVPLFATSLTFSESIHSSYYDFTFVWDAFADKAVQYQAYTYYPVMALARFNLYLLSVCYLLSAKSRRVGSTAWIRPTELAFMACYWFLFGYLLLWRSIPTWTLRVAFVLVSHMITMPLHVQITLSHWGMPTADLGEAESFPQRQLRTTMDVDCPAWLDFIHGGLQFQACHHLFPRVPRHNLRRLQVLVREFCAETKIPYKILGFADGNREVLGRLTEVGRQVGYLIKCQQYMAETNHREI